jgi:putative ABC transport system permease protein
MIVGQALRLALLGMTLGLLSAGAITRVMESLLFKVSPTDHNVFALVSIFLVAVSLTAAYTPARKATRIDPLVALRYE